MPTISKAVRAAVGLDDDEEPLFWPDAEALSNPHALCYVGSAQLWLSCRGDAASPVSVLYGPPDEGFTWQAAGSQFADYSCDWGRLRKAFEAT